MASFSSSAFDTSAFSPNSFDFDGLPEPESRGGFDDRHYKHYRGQLEKLAKVADERDAKKYVKEVVELAKIAEKDPIDKPVLDAIADAAQLDRTEIDFTLAAKEIARIISLIDTLIYRQIQMNRERDDEEALMLLIA